MDGCNTCKLIERSSFPFRNDKGGDFSIDTEGCGGVNSVDLKFCPTCGRKLKDT